MATSRRVTRYAALSIVISLVLWTTRFSHDNYRILSQPNSWLGSGNQWDVTNMTDPVKLFANNAQGTFQESHQQKATSHMQTEVGTEVHTGNGNEDFAQQQEYQMLHDLTSGHITPLSGSGLSVETSLTISHQEASFSATGSDTTKQTETGQEEKTSQGYSGQNKQPQDVSESPAGSNFEGRNITSGQVQEYVDSILHLNATNLKRLECPGETSNHPRYEVLRRHHTPESKIKFLFAMDLYQNVEILPRLLGTVIRAAQYLGFDNCGLSIVEGRSTDGSYAVLDELRAHLSELGLHYWLQQSDINPKDGDVDRVEALAQSRNMALIPLLDETNLFDEKPLLIFINDIVPCPDDLYEMIYQHALQKAVQSCAMDWIEKGENFYDVWVSRSMTGDTFWEIPQDGSWTFVQNLFFDDPFTKDKYTRGMPFQVFSCWGGMTVMEGLPFIDRILQIRRNYEGECYGGEPQMLGSDWAKLGLSRVQTVPRVNVGYNNEEGMQVKALRKYVHESVDVDKLVERFEDDDTTERIEWTSPPSRIRCMVDFHSRWWVDAWYDPKKKGQGS